MVHVIQESADDVNVVLVYPCFDLVICHIVCWTCLSIQPHAQPANHDEDELYQGETPVGVWGHVPCYACQASPCQGIADCVEEKKVHYKQCSMQ